MKRRRGVALLAALWLVVAIATVALQFSIEAHERRTIGLLASERGVQRAAASGALALVFARMDQALRVAPTGTNAAVQRLRASDAWLDADSTFGGPVFVDSMQVDVEAHDLGEKLNINSLSENELRIFFSFLLSDFAKAGELSQAIMDWRDPDSIPRPNGAERDAYIKAELLALPTNAPFRDVEDLENVMGMTPEIYALASPYFTTRGLGMVNLNTAPVPVLRALPGMTDATVNIILQMRSQGRRIQNVADVLPSAARGGRPNTGQINSQLALSALQSRATVNTLNVELTITARVGPQAAPSKLTAIITRPNTGTQARISYQQW